MDRWQCACSFRSYIVTGVVVVVVAAVVAVVVTVLLCWGASHCALSLSYQRRIDWWPCTHIAVVWREREERERERSRKEELVTHNTLSPLSSLLLSPLSSLLLSPLSFFLLLSPSLALSPLSSLLSLLSLLSRGKLCMYVLCTHTTLHYVTVIMPAVRGETFWCWLSLLSMVVHASIQGVRKVGLNFSNVTQRRVFKVNGENE